MNKKCLEVCSKEFFNLIRCEITNRVTSAHDYQEKLESSLFYIIACA